jgi:hypothetical protein
MTISGSARVEEAVSGPKTNIKRNPPSHAYVCLKASRTRTVLTRTPRLMIKHFSVVLLLAPSIDNTMRDQQIFLE